MVLKFLDKSEKKYIVYSAVFSILYFFIAIPIFSKWLDDSNIFLEFLILNVGFLFIIQIFMKSIASNSKPKAKNVLGLLFLFLALSCWSVPLSIQMDGSLSVPSENSPRFILGATDYFGGYVISKVLHVSGGFTIPAFIPYIGGTFIGWVFLITYTLFPMILLFISSRLLKNFVSNV
jgi:hypothetical protein